MTHPSRQRGERVDASSLVPAGFQRFLEFFLTECNCLIVNVRAFDFKIHAVAHEPPAAGRPTLRSPKSIFAVLVDGSAGKRRISYRSG